jgi:hypothetical protein
MSRFAAALTAVLFVPAAVQDEMEDNVEYTSWAKQKPGAWVKWAVETNTGALKMASEVTWTLKELAPDKAVIEEKTVMNVTGAEKPAEHTSSRSIPAKVKKGTTSEGGKVEPLKEGDEELEIKGRKIKCHWVEMKLQARAGGAMKVWKTDEIVGGAAKTSIKHDDAAKMTMTMTVVDWKAAE